MCQVLKVSRSRYYEWLKGKVSARSKWQDELRDKISDTYFACKQRYGSPRLTIELEKQGIQVSRPTVAKLMRKMGLRSKISKKYVPSTTDSKHDKPISPNLLSRNFKVDQAARVWVSDISYLVVEEGFLYLTVILDLYQRKVVAWSLSETLRTEDTVLPAWYQALAKYRLRNGLIFHSDRGVQYASESFRNALKAEKVEQSMSRRANCWDNAVAESFFKSLKTEAIYGQQIKSREEMKSLIFEYIEIWYNRQRRHSYIGYKTILELENEHKFNYSLIA